MLRYSIPTLTTIAALLAAACSGPSPSAEGEAAGAAKTGSETGSCALAFDAANSATFQGCASSEYCALDNPAPARWSGPRVSRLDRKAVGQCVQQSRLIDYLAAYVRATIPGVSSERPSATVETILRPLPRGTLCEALECYSEATPPLKQTCWQDPATIPTSLFPGLAGNEYPDEPYDANGPVCSQRRSQGWIMEGGTERPGILLGHFPVVRRDLQLNDLETQNFVNHHRVVANFGDYPGVPGFPLELEFRLPLETFGKGDGPAKPELLATPEGMEFKVGPKMIAALKQRCAPWVTPGTPTVDEPACVFTAKSYSREKK
jgi:hypothetical protein